MQALAGSTPHYWQLHINRLMLSSTLIDELGFDRLEQHDARNASLFFKVIDGRYCKGSTLITTNIDFKELGDYLGDPVVTTAIVDRMVHHSIIINIIGPSYRMHESKKLNAKVKKHSDSK